MESKNYISNKHYEVLKFDRWKKYVSYQKGVWKLMPKDMKDTYENWIKLDSIGMHPSEHHKFNYNSNK